MPPRETYRPARRLLLLLLCLVLTACGLTPPRRTAPPPESSSFAIHFIDVGQGDSALVLCDGAAMLIDGGESDQSSLLYSYLRDLDIRHLDYLVATHTPTTSAASAARCRSPGWARPSPLWTTGTPRPSGA